MLCPRRWIWRDFNPSWPIQRASRTPLCRVITFAKESCGTGVNRCVVSPETVAVVKIVVIAMQFTSNMPNLHNFTISLTVILGYNYSGQQWSRHLIPTNEDLRPELSSHDGISSPYFPSIHVRKAGSLFIRDENGILGVWRPKDYTMTAWNSCEERQRNGFGMYQTQKPIGCCGLRILGWHKTKLQHNSWHFRRRMLLSNKR